MAPDARAVGAVVPVVVVVDADGLLSLVTVPAAETDLQEDIPVDLGDDLLGDATLLVQVVDVGGDHVLHQASAGQSRHCSVAHGRLQAMHFVPLGVDADALRLQRPHPLGPTVVWVPCGSGDPSPRLHDDVPGLADPSGAGPGMQQQLGALDLELCAVHDVRFPLGLHATQDGNLGGRQSQKPLCRGLLSIQLRALTAAGDGSGLGGLILAPLRIFRGSAQGGGIDMGVRLQLGACSQSQCGVHFNRNTHSSTCQGSPKPVGIIHQVTGWTVTVGVPKGARSRRLPTGPLYKAIPFDKEGWVVRRMFSGLCLRTLVLAGP
mmetsp:Transcript_20143/g.35995  ORF Transcript_20143/g.35995 Transcript_20143/m.35995 type:complete len:320 (+) Transcript_20143:550-1509(+)